MDNGQASCSSRFGSGLELSPLHSFARLLLSQASGDQSTGNVTKLKARESGKARICLEISIYIYDIIPSHSTKRFQSPLLQNFPALDSRGFGHQPGYSRCNLHVKKVGKSETGIQRFGNLSVTSPYQKLLMQGFPGHPQVKERMES